MFIWVNNVTEQISSFKLQCKYSIRSFLIINVGGIINNRGNWSKYWKTNQISMKNFGGPGLEEIWTREIPFLLTLADDS